MLTRKTKKIKVLCTAFRDGFQSVFGSRVLPKDYLPVIKMARQAGIDRFESGGGALFQSAFFYLNQNAFDVMDDLRKAVGKDTFLQTLARGVNVVGLESQSSDIIQLHARLFKKHGVDCIRNFDALNDPDNLAYSAQCIVEAGLQHQLAIAMMSLPPGCSGAHTADFYENILKKIIQAKIPFHSLAFKDASGTSLPSVVFDTITKARKLIGNQIPIEFHSHDTAGTGTACYLSAIEAGADVVDLSLSPVSGGTCQPDIATLWHALRQTHYELDLDIDKVLQVEQALQEALQDYFMPPEAMKVEPLIPWSPMPGGALTSNTQMLRDNGLLDKYGQIIHAMEEVVRKGGFGTSVTPVSQFYFQQAFNNVMFGPWKKIAEGYGKMVLGYFGKTPKTPDEKVIQIASEQLGLQPTKQSPRLLNDKDKTKGIEPAKAILQQNNLPITDENIFIVATCKEKGVAFLKGEGKISVRYKQKPSNEMTDNKIIDKVQQIVLDGQTFNVELKNGEALVNGKSYSYHIQQSSTLIPTTSMASTTSATSTTSTPTDAKTPTSITGKSQMITAPMAGVVIKINVKIGDFVKKGQDLLTLEVMKMENPIKATTDGKIEQIAVASGDQVATGQNLITIGG